MRHVVWFSCGAASAVMSKLVCNEHPDAIVAYCDTGGEHPDNRRFLSDVQGWLNKEVVILKNPNYEDHFDVVQKTRYVNGPSGARCTVELKKKLRFEFQAVDDIQYFGYTKDEQRRADTFHKSFPEVYASFPLIEQGLSKQNCLAILAAQGLEIPVMYTLGFNNNNCIGCVKGGAGYWNQIRIHFPEQFNKMAKIEREVGHSCIKGIFLDELAPAAGRHKSTLPSCDFVCEQVNTEL